MQCYNIIYNNTHFVLSSFHPFAVYTYIQGHTFPLRFPVFCLRISVQKTSVTSTSYMNLLFCVFFLVLPSFPTLFDSNSNFTTTTTTTVAHIQYCNCAAIYINLSKENVAFIILQKYCEFHK